MVVAVTLFVAQVGQRMAVYFQYKTNVDVEVKYVETVDFPSVTVCNQNNYRLTLIYIYIYITSNLRKTGVNIGVLVNRFYM